MMGISCYLLPFVSVIVFNGIYSFSIPGRDEISNYLCSVWMVEEFTRKVRSSSQNLWKAPRAKHMRSWRLGSRVTLWEQSRYCCRSKSQLLIPSQLWPWLLSEGLRPEVCIHALRSHINDFCMLSCYILYCSQGLTPDSSGEEMKNNQHRQIHRKAGLSGVKMSLFWKLRVFVTHSWTGDRVIAYS